MDLNRRNNFTFNPSNELLYSMLGATNNSTDHTNASIILLCKFIQKLQRSDVETEIAKLSDMTGCPLQNIVQVYLQELNQIESDFPAHVNTNSE